MEDYRELISIAEDRLGLHSFEPYPDKEWTPPESVLRSVIYYDPDASSSHAQRDSQTGELFSERPDSPEDQSQPSGVIIDEPQAPVQRGRHRRTGDTLEMPVLESEQPHKEKLTARDYAWMAVCAGAGAAAMGWVYANGGSEFIKDHLERFQGQEPYIVQPSETFSSPSEVSEFSPKSGIDGSDLSNPANLCITGVSSGVAVQFEDNR